MNKRKKRKLTERARACMGRGVHRLHVDQRWATACHMLHSSPFRSSTPPMHDAEDGMKEGDADEAKSESAAVEAEGKAVTTAAEGEAVTTAKVEMLPERPCSKCKEPIVDQALLEKCQECNTVTCKGCNCKRATLSKVFGSWPIEPYKEMHSELQDEFWKEPCNSREAIVQSLAKKISTFRTKYKVEGYKGKFLPLAAWERIGWEPAIIDNTVVGDDVKLHAKTGIRTYRVDVEEIKEGTSWKSVHQELLDLVVPRGVRGPC